MDIEYLQNQGVFQPIETFSNHKFHPDQLIFESEFSVLPYAQEHLLLTLTKNVLLLSRMEAGQTNPHSIVPLSFELKFEILYETQKNIYSNKLGFSLFFDNAKTINLYSNKKSKIELWLDLLAKRINQRGFHQMFRPLKKLGKGNFASVYEVQRQTDHKHFAVKAFSKQNSFSAKNGKQSLINELTIMRELSSEKHRNVLTLEGVFESQNSIYVVLELLPGCQLFHKIQQANGFFTPAEIKQFMHGLLSGLLHLHKHRIMHRDLKPQNIMLRDKNQMSPVIVDFGLATPCDLQTYLFFRCGTPGYVAPQIIQLNQCKHIEPECDIFSAGVIFHILLTRKALFQGTKYDQVYRKNKQMNFNLESQFYKKYDRVSMSLLKLMLTAKPKDRITAQQALNHQYFTGQKQQEMIDQLFSPISTNVSISGNEKDRKKSKKTFFLF